MVQADIKSWWTDNRRLLVLRWQQSGPVRWIIGLVLSLILLNSALADVLLILDRNPTSVGDSVLPIKGLQPVGIEEQFAGGIGGGGG